MGETGRRVGTTLAVLGFDRWARRGLAATAEGLGVAVVVTSSLGSADHDVLRRAATTDLALVDVDLPGWDRWGGLACVSALRAVRSGAAGPTVVVVSDRANDLHLRRRCAEVGVDVLLPAAAVATEADLSAVLDAPRRRALPPPNPVELRGAGLRPGGSITAALEAVQGTRAAEAMARGEAVAATGLSRREVLRVRRTVSGLARLCSSADRAAGGPHRDLTLPTWREVAAFVDRARGAVAQPGP
jgi:CheY-like chemotaxis protein